MINNGQPPRIEHPMTMPTLDEVEKLTDETKKRNPKDPYTTELGVVLKLRRISTDVIRRAWTAIPIPKPPDVWIEDHGRYEPNPVDPGYNNELNLYNNKVNSCIHQIVMMRAVDIVLPLPPEVPGPDSDEWTEGLDEFFDMPKGRLARKAMWLLDYILDDRERDEIIGNIMKISNMVPEDKVDEAMDSFRSDGIPEPDKEVSDTARDTD